MIKSAFIIGTIMLTLGIGTSLAATAQNGGMPASLKVPAGNQLFLHVYAKGVQIYRCVQDQKDTSQFTWTFVAPAADLYTSADYTTHAGRHYAGPTWEATDGSKVTGKKLQQADGPDTAAIPWLLLSAGSVIGSGIFAGTTFIQRINTHGGKPATVTTDRPHPGQEIRAPYTAEYLFYRAIH